MAKGPTSRTTSPRSPGSRRTSIIDHGKSAGSGTLLSVPTPRIGTVRPALLGANGDDDLAFGPPVGQLPDGCPGLLQRVLGGDIRLHLAGLPPFNQGVDVGLVALGFACRERAPEHTHHGAAFEQR